ncbi:putative extracellular chitinase [Erysiphe necator]|uniref:Putative extracellular chitinase n=1 Tax=Uncinula necator TaxID=52586 RepID=A0A0B1P9S0_UNCNE|nr:putative extracellular chitinase [Erysiphe necator]
MVRVVRARSINALMASVALPLGFGRISFPFPFPFPISILVLHLVLNFANRTCSGSTPDYCNNCQGSAFGSGCQTPSISSLFQTAIANGITDEDAGGQYYFDRANNLFWTWDTATLIARKFNDIVAARGLGGVMAWSLAQDSYDFGHILALQKGAREMHLNATKSETKNYVSSRIMISSSFGNQIQNTPTPPASNPWWKPNWLKKLWPF